jgi:phosphatidylglycerol:prolipoprotein diacylglycerol transferase
MYLLGFLTALYWAKRQVRLGKIALSIEQVESVLVYGILGVILGGKIGHWIFYQPDVLLQAPWEVLMLWHPGMSFHGGVIGVAIAVALFTRKNHLHFIDIPDALLPIVPLGLGLGRIGNFINGELWGRVTDSPIGMIFPGAGPFPRYPSQLIECLLEGVFLLLILQILARHPTPRYRISGAFLVGYAIMRIFCEFFRDPNMEWGILAWGWLTMGQVLSVPMLILGIFFFKYSCSQGQEKKA